MSLYDEIVRNAPGSEPVAAGFLHEDVWVALLEKEDLNIVGTRLARGDKGIDALSVVDPKLGNVSAYQAKLCTTIDEKKQAEIVKGFVKAMSNQMKVVRWTLLVPITLTTTAHDWLNVSLKDEALALVTDPETRNRISECEVRHHGESAMLRLLSQHPEVARTLLPDSTLAVSAMYKEALDETNLLKTEIVSRLLQIQESQVRDRIVQQRTSEASIRMLNQGWADEEGMIRRAVQIKKADELEIALRSFSAFLNRQFEFAIRVEALMPGTSSSLMKLYASSRLVTQAAVLYSISQRGSEPPGEEELPLDPFQEARGLCEEAQAFRRELGKVLRVLTLPT